MLVLFTRAELAGPSTLVAVPLPTRVMSVPLAKANRIRWPRKSAMYRFP